MDASILCDASANIVAWSKGAEQLLGWSAEEAIGKSAMALIVPVQHRVSLGRDIDALCKYGNQSSASQRRHAALLHKDGRLLQIEYLVTSIRLEERSYFGVSVWDRSGQKNGLDNLSEARLTVNLSRDAIILTDTEGKILLWNHGAEHMFGFPEHEAVGRQQDALLSAQYPVGMADLMRQLAQNGYWEGEVAYTTRNQHKFVSLSRWVLEPGSAPDRARILITITDVNLWKKQVSAAVTTTLQGMQSFDSLFGLHPDGVLTFNAQGQLIAVNAAVSTLTGYSNKELLCMPLAQLVAPEDLAKLRFNFSEAMQGTPETHEFTCIKKDKTRFDASITMLPFLVNDKISGLHLIVKDVSHRKLDERRILYLATHDPLTGLANRDLLYDRMQNAVEQARRQRSQAGILFMDLNRFKVINDSLGHGKGDILLCTIADRLNSAVREIDTVARLGGDEFVVLLENISSPEHVATVAGNLLNLVKQPIEIDDHLITVSTSIGASIYPQDGEDAATLLKNADLAMYEAKRSGTGGFRLYTADLNARVMGQLARENSLRDALDRGELTLCYQPRLDLAKKKLVGAEALIRWQHPEKGIISPIEFIPLAEEIGVIDTIGSWVLLNACRQLKAWHDAGLTSIKMSVNISTIQLRSEHILETIEKILDEAGLNADRLELEITESNLMQNLDTSYDKLMKIKAMGISLSIDDFGTGYSSLNYLRRLPIDTLKIDKSFVREVPDNIDDAAIVSATIAMAHSMNLRVVAEGVDSFEQMRFLESHHCDEIQGYLVSEPLPPAEAEALFRSSEMQGFSWVHS